MRAHMIRPLFFLLLAAGTAFACSVPVFRYALEHWEADAYRVTAPASAKLPENYVVTTGTEPKIELRQPKSARNDAVIWSAPFSEANVAVLLQAISQLGLDLRRHFVGVPRVLHQNARINEG